MAEKLANLLWAYSGNIRRIAASLHMDPTNLRKQVRRYKLEDVLREARR